MGAQFFIRVRVKYAYINSTRWFVDILFKK